MNHLGSNSLQKYLCLYVKQWNLFKAKPKKKFISIHNFWSYRSYLLLKSMFKTTRRYNLFASIFSRYQATSADTLKEHESQIVLMTLLWGPSILSLGIQHCLPNSVSTLSWWVFTNNILARVYLGTPGSQRSMSLWLTYS